MVLEPGESTGVHTHHHDYVFHVLEGSRLEITDALGQTLFTRHFEVGELSAPRVEGDMLVDGESRVPATHSARNIGPSRFSEVLVEKK